MVSPPWQRKVMTGKARTITDGRAALTVARNEMERQYLERRLNDCC